MTKNNKTFAKKFNNSFAPAWSTFRLFNSYFFKTIYGPILAFVFPTLILAILGNILRIEYVFPGIVALSSMFIAVQAMPLGIMEMKNSTLFKYIGASPMSSKKFSLVIIFYYIFIDFVAIIILILMTAAIFHNKVFNNGHLTDPGSLFSGILTGFGFFSFMSANLIHILLGLAIGITIATLSKTPQQALTIGLIIVIPTMFLSGMVITVDIIAQSDVMQWISRFMPFRYTTGNIIVASTPLNQLGDFYSLISESDKHMLFDDTIVQEFNDKKFTSRDIIANYNSGLIGSGANGSGIKDQELFNMLFIKNADSITAGADNNMFNLMSEFGVRKTPDMPKIEGFLKEYLHASGQAGFNNLGGLADKIKNGDFGWMGLFTNQTMKLYSVAERSLNVFLPLLISGGLLFTSYKKFKWTSR